jgi:ubiquinone biosynthesis protein
LKEISLGRVLLRLFQTSRQFNVEVQPQLVLLQKTLLNIEGLGRELDPELDLWQTALPFLERWMSEQLGWVALENNIKREASSWAKLLPTLPRLVHQALSATASPAPNLELESLSAEVRGLRHLLWLAIGVATLALGFSVLQ